MCHYTRRGQPRSMGRFVADGQPAVTTGELWSQICADSHGSCDPRSTRSEGTPDIVEERNGYFYVTFHGYSAPLGYRGVAKTADFHNWSVAGPDLPGAPIVAPTEGNRSWAWNSWLHRRRRISTLIAGGYQYMMVETPPASDLSGKPGQTWPIVLLRAPKGSFPAWSSAEWQKFPGNPLLATAWPGPKSQCGIQYPRWAVANGHVYILYEDFGYDASAGAPTAFKRRLLRLFPGPGPTDVRNK